MRVRFSNSQINFTRHVLQQCHRVKSYGVYQREKIEEGRRNELTKKVRIERFRGKSDAFDIEYYLRLRDASNWAECTQITGLRRFDEVTFYGDDSRGEKSFLILHFQNNGKTLVIDYFNSFYPYTPKQRNSILKSVKKALPKYENAFTDFKIHQMNLFKDSLI